MHWSDGNLRAIDDYLDDKEHDEECEICDELDCDCAENAELDRGDYLMEIEREKGWGDV